MDSAETATRGSEVPTDVRSLLELVAERLNLTSRTARLTVDLEDGRVRYVVRQERIKGTDLERF
jgi:hypothetical protein